MRLAYPTRASLRRWDVKYQMPPEWSQEAQGDLRVLGDLINERSQEAAEGVLQGSINFGGAVTIRQNSRGNKGKLYVAKTGDVVFSRIDVRNGAIGVLSGDVGELAFSNEYPIFALRESSDLRPSFLRLLCRTSVFRQQVNARTIGHSGRKRLPSEEFERMSVPVPPLTVQDEILEQLDRRLEESESLRQRALPLIAEAGAEMLKVLGVDVPVFDAIRVPFQVSRSQVLRWSVRKGMAAKQGVVQELTSSRALMQLGRADLSNVAYGLTKSPSNRPGANARPYLRVANVQDAFLDLRVVKEIEVPDGQMDRFRLKFGDLLLCEGNSKELVGRPAMWQDEIPDCVHQNHVLRVRVNPHRLLPEYVLAFMHGPAGRWYFGEAAKQTTNLATINSTDLKRFPLPVPDLDEQRELAAVVTKARDAAAKLRGEANQLDVATDTWLSSRLGGQVVLAAAVEDAEDGGGDEDSETDDAPEAAG